MATILTSDKVKVYVEGVAIGCLTSATLSLGKEFKDVQCSDADGFVRKVPGLKSWSISGQWVWDKDAAFKFSNLFTLWEADTQVTVKMADSSVGGEGYEGEAYVGNMEWNSPGNGDPNTGSVEFQGFGEIAAAA